MESRYSIDPERHRRGWIGSLPMELSGRAVRLGDASRGQGIARLAAALVMVAAPLAQAAPHRCTAADGHVSFQDAPCAPGTVHAPSAAEPPRPDDASARAMPASFYKLQQLTIFAAKCPLHEIARAQIDLIQQQVAPTWPTKKIDEQTAHELLVASILHVDGEMKANPATACEHAQHELDDWIRRIPGAQKRLDDVAPMYRHW